jgi:3-deoxy-D-manno-octulosonic acid kinase
MSGFDANEHLSPFRDSRGYGAILFDRSQVRQPEPDWFSPGHWGDAAQMVTEGGRGGACRPPTLPAWRHGGASEP